MPSERQEPAGRGAEIGSLLRRRACWAADLGLGHDDSPSRRDRRRSGRGQRLRSRSPAIGQQLAAVVEILPKTVAVSNGDRTALLLAPLLALVTRALRPLTASFLWVTDGLIRVFGGQPHVGPFVTEDDIKTLVNVGVEQNVLEEQERELIHSIIEFGDTIVREVMTPRTDMVTVGVTDPAAPRARPRHRRRLLQAAGLRRDGRQRRSASCTTASC